MTYERIGMWGRMNMPLQVASDDAADRLHSYVVRLGHVVRSWSR